MAYRNLEEFLNRLDQSGDVKRHAVESLGTEVPSGNSKQIESVHLYEDMKAGHRFVRDLFGTRVRVEQALRVMSLTLISDRLDAMLDLGRPGAFGAMIGQAMQLFSALRTNTNRRAAQLFESSSVESWTESLRGKSVLSTLMSGGQTAVMRAVNVDFSDGGCFVFSAPPLPIGERVALVFGGCPAFIIAAMTPLPDLVHRSYLASWLRERPLEVMHLPTVEIDIPSNSEAVVVGTIQDVTDGPANQFFEPDSARLSISVESVQTRPGTILMQWSERERVVVGDALFEIFRPLICRLLPGLSEDQLRPFIAATAAEFIAARTLSGSTTKNPKDC